MNLSYSGLEVLHSCPRKFELEKLCAPEGTEISSLDLVCGHSLGEGLQAVMRGDSLEQAAFAAYNAWTFQRGARSVDIFETSAKKSFNRVLMHVEKFQANNPFWEDGWQLWTLPNGRPACEVGFYIELPNGYCYRGFIDFIMQRVSNPTELAAVEIKSSGFKDPNPAMWANSFQGLSYACILDYITKSCHAYQPFLICEFDKDHTHIEQRVLPFYRTPKDKLSWLPALALDVRSIEMYKKMRHFPMRGGSCFNYFRPCPHLSVCNLDRPNDWIEQEKDKPEAYDFHFSVDELIDFATAML